MTARTLVRYANPYLGGHVYVENIADAAGAVGYRTAAKTKPDGYTLVLIGSGILAKPHVTKDYPTLDLFDMICVVVQDPLALTTKPDGRFRTAADLISYAKAHPGEVTAGSAGGVGSAHHLLMSALEVATGAKFSLVPFAGDSPTLSAAMGGHIDISVASCSASKTLVESKKLRPLVVSDSERSNLYPDVPTFKELGYDVVNFVWMSVGTSKGTPKQVEDVLVGAFRKATQDEGYKKLTDQMGVKQIFLDSEKAGPWLRAQDNRIRNLATKIGLKPE
jgi:tripartite-type tricarboxylate transporter receptor subunit TctC